MTQDNLNFESNGTASQNSKILAHLLAGHTLTSLESLDFCGSLRLGARRDDLRRIGYNVESEMIKVGRKRVARYFIPPDNQLIPPSERKKKPKSVTIDRLRELAREVAAGDLLTELAFSRLIIAAEKS